MRLRVIVYGEPVPQGRPRLNKYTGHAYDPEKSKVFKEYVRLCAAQKRPDFPIEGPVRMSLKIYRSIPKGMSKKKADLANNGIFRPITKPDVSNVLKGVEDALTGIWYKDDSQIVEFGKLAKYYSLQPRVEIEVEELE